MKPISLFVFVAIIIQICNAQEINYLNQTPPGDVPEVFAPGTISKPDSVAEQLVFSNDGQWLFYNQRDPNYITYRLMYMKYENGNWITGKKASFFPEMDNASNASFSPDGKSLIFDGGYDSTGFYVPKTMKLVDNIWNQPVPKYIPTTKEDIVCCPHLTEDSTIYFSKRTQQWPPYDVFNIYKSEISNGAYSNAELVIENAGESCFVSKDESYIIFSSYKLGNKDYGSSDLYITFHKQDGSWTNPENMGSTINTSSLEYFPVLSPDYKYLFFSRWVKFSSRYSAYIYWVKAEKLIDSLKSVALSPKTVIGQIEEQKIEIYPNPTNGLIDLSFDKLPAKKLLVELITLQGNLVFSATFYNKSTATIDLKKFSAGMYILKADLDGVCYKRKVLKE
jgi:hypothetical protein